MLRVFFALDIIVLCIAVMSKFVWHLPVSWWVFVVLGLPVAVVVGIFVAFFRVQ